MLPTEKEWIEEKFRGVYSRMDSRDELFYEKLDQILKQTTLTNGRVNKIEKEHEDTKVARWFSESPQRFFGSILIIIIVYSLIPEKVWELIFK